MDKAGTFGDLRGKNKLTGLVPVVPTPMNEDESLDEGGFERMAQEIVEQGFEGIWALASAGEDQNLPRDEIERAAKLLVKYLGGKIPILVKTSMPGLKQSIERNRRMTEIGFDAAIVHVEQKWLGRDHVRRFYQEFAESSPLPVYLYQNALRGTRFDVDLLLEMTRHPKIAGLKAGGSALGELHPVCQLADPDCSVMVAGAGQMVPGFAMGASAHTTVAHLMFPKKARAIHDLMQAGRLEAAREEQRVLLRFIRAMPKLNNREIQGEVKAVLEIRGIMQRHVSAPFLSATDEQVQQFRDLLDEYDL